MSIDYSGGMLVGCHGSKFSVSEEYFNEHLADDFEEDFEDVCRSELIEAIGLSEYSEHYDADEDSRYVGFEVHDTNIHSLDFEDWLTNVRSLASMFEDVSGVTAKLIGTQNIW